MRARPLPVAFVAVAAAALAGVVACQAVSGLSELERDESFDPDAEAALDVAFPDPDAAVVDAAPDAALPDTSGDTGDAAACEGTTFGGHCYFVLLTEQTWPDAKAACEAAGAHLVVFETDAELAAIADLDGTSERWIGLSRDADAGPTSKDSFRWVTGAPLTVDNWATYDGGAPEPDGNGACVRALGGGKWADRACDLTHKAVCERE